MGEPASPGSGRAHTRKTRPAAGRDGGRERAAGPGPTMQPLEVGSIPAAPGEPRLTRWLRKGSGILAHLVALSFTLFLTLLSRPGTSEWPGRLGECTPDLGESPLLERGSPCAQNEAVGGATGGNPLDALLAGRKILQVGGALPGAPQSRAACCSVSVCLSVSPWTFAFSVASWLLASFPDHSLLISVGGLLAPAPTPGRQIACTQPEAGAQSQSALFHS